MSHGASRSGSTSRWPTCPCCRRSPRGSWLTGEPDARLDAATATLDDVAGLSGVQWAVGDLLVWLARVGRDTGSEALRDGVAEPFRLELVGRHDDAAAAWTEIGAPYEAALAAVHGSHAGRAARAVEDLERLAGRRLRRPRP